MTIILPIISSLIASIIVVLVYRQIDQKNRNFEKIARLSKTIKQELSDFADERLQDFKDFDNCVEVTFQKGKNILDDFNKSINAVEQRMELLEREKEKISMFYQKIDMIDKEIGDINTQITEIQNEKEFIKGVDTRINKFKKQIAIVDRDLNKIEDDFRKDNIQSLKLISDKLLKDTVNEMKDVKKEMVVMRKEIDVRREEMIKNIKESGIDLRKDLKETQIKLIDFTNNQKKVLQENAETFKNELYNIEGTINGLRNDFFKEVENDFYKLKEDYENMINEKNKEVEDIEIGLQSRLEEKINNYSNYISKIDENCENISSIIKKDLEENKIKQIEEMKKYYGVLTANIEKFGEKIKLNATKSVTIVAKDVENKYKTLLANFRKIESEASSKALDFEAFLKDTTERMNRIKSNIYKDINEKIEEYDMHMKNINELGISLELEVFDNIKSRLESFRIKIYEEIENIGKEALDKSVNFEEELKSRHEKSISKANEIAGMIDNLQNELDQISGDFNGKIFEISEKQKVITDEFDKKSSDLRHGYHGEIDKYKKLLSANLIKIREYFDNEKKKIFTGIDKDLQGFVKETGSKTNDIYDRFEKTYKDVEKRLLSIQNEMSKKISSIENSLINNNNILESQLKSKIDSFGDKIDETLLENGNLVEEKIHDFNERIENYIKAANDTISNMEFKFSENKNKIDQIDNSISGFMSEIELLKNNTESNLKTISSDLQNKLFMEINNRFNNNEKELNELYIKLKDNINTNLGNWDNNITEIIKDMNVKIEDFKYDIEDLKSNSSDSINKMKENFVNEIENWTRKTLEDNAGEIERFKNEIEKYYRENAEKLVADNANKLSEFVNNFKIMKNDLDNLKTKIDQEVALKIDDGKKAINDVYNDGTIKLKEHFNLIEREAVDKINQYRKEMVNIQQNMKQIDDRFSARFLEHANGLDKKIEKIDEEIKRFEKATKLYDRADLLKDKLNNDLKTIKEDIINIKKDRNEILKVEKKMMNIESVAASSLEKYRLILDEKKRIENVENVLGELEQISDSVNQKIDNIKNAKLMITNVEEKIENVNKKFFKLDKNMEELKQKDTILNKSIKSIDNIKDVTDDLNKKFDNLLKQYSDLEFKRNTYEKSFKNFEKDANLITKSEKKVAEVIDKFKQMDSLVEDLEARIDVINKYREWLVKAETQIVNLNHDTDKKIKLLQSLLSNSSKSTIVQDKMNNDDSKREVILKLKKQGWTIDEIAKSLDLSIGEVEFILDLEHSKVRKR